MYQLVNTKEEYKARYPYKGYKPNKYPKFPALVYVDSVDGGLMGDYYCLYVIEIPKGVDIDSFTKGVNTHPKTFR